MDGTGELWWRYEALGEGVVKDRTRNRAIYTARANGETGSGCGGAAEGLSSERGSSGGTEEEVMVRVNCPIRVLDPKHGVYECHPQGKEAQTVGGWAEVVCSCVCVRCFFCKGDSLCER